jgi:hypothetical protein
VHIAIAIVGNATDIVACMKALEQSIHDDFEVVVHGGGH